MPSSPSPGRCASAIAWVSRRLKSRADSEHELTLSRIGFVVVCALLLTIINYGNGGPPRLPHGLTPFFIHFGLFMVATALLFAHLLWKPEVSIARRMIGMPLDICNVAFLMHSGDERTVFTYPILLWAIFGNGFRFGVNYLFIAAGLGFASFACVVWTTPFWYENPELSGGMLAALIILPAYVSHLIRRLSEAKQQAEEASRAKSLFLASISHELRTPLNAVIGLSDALVGTGLDQKRSEMARTIGKSGRSLLSLINSLLDVSRMELGKKPQMGPFDLHGLLHDIRSILSVQANEKGVPLGLHIDPALPRRVVGSTRHFEEVLINLAGNAVKFTSKGFVLIEAKRIDSAQEGACRMRFEVTDTGIGIAPAAQARIFESFTQADETIIDRFGGTGLGLSIARQLVEAHGGAIGVVSEIGKGSTFWFEMEARLDETQPAPAPATLRALVLSRDAALVDAVSAYGCVTQAVETADDLHDLMQRDPVGREAVLIDQRMIDADGDAILAALDAAEATPSRACLLLGAGEDVAIDLRRRFVSRLPLPLDATALQRILLLAAGSEEESHAPSDAQTPARPLDILVAEDNRTNQMVIKQILARGDHNVTVVENGDLAVEALLQGSFDLVLMDVNMPVMNGLDASKFYQFAMLGQKATPIVALTADATPETAAKCRDAGMADCLNKPIDATALLALVRKYGDSAPLRDAAPVVEAAAPEIESVEAGDALGDNAIDERALSDLAALGGDAFVSEIATQFVEDAAGVLQRLSDAVAQLDVAAFQDEAHALRSCAANVGAQAVFKICLDLRAIESQELAARGEQHVRELERQFERARIALEPHLR